MYVSTEQLYGHFLTCDSVSTDTRQLQPGALFFALKGPNFDANAFAPQALEKGARFAVVDDPEFATDPRTLLVESGLQALQELARHHRSQLNQPVVGITGSNGKTTTKELIHAVLQKKYRVLATAGNLNNHIGVPLTVLSINGEVEIAVVEMGANHLGEIAELCGLCRPTHGLITNIGRAHIEGFGSLEGVMRGKSELYDFLIKTGGTVFINSQDDILRNMAKRFPNPYFYPSQGDYLHLEFTRADPFVHFYNEQHQEIATQLIGRYNFNNLAAALCIGKFFGVPALLAESAVADYVPRNNRSQIIRKATNTIILDAYNANPSSMEAALNNLGSMEGTNRVAILGDMLELGEESEEAHRQLGVWTRGMDQVLLCGQHTRAALEKNPKASHFPNQEALERFLRQHPITESTILIKASRSMGLERLVDYI